jgi:hypothetical protein
MDDESRSALEAAWNKQAIDTVQTLERMRETTAVDGMDMAQVVLRDAADLARAGGAGIEGLTCSVSWVCSQLLTMYIDMAQKVGGSKPIERAAVYDLLRENYAT